MTVPKTGAASRPVEPWDSTDWSAAAATVRRLQARIVKATREGRWNKVKALQRLLTTHFRGAAKLLAVKRVTESEGKDTPGVDGEIWNTPVKKANAVHTLRHRGYQPRPLRRVYIPKSNGRAARPPRDTDDPGPGDAGLLHLLALDPVAENDRGPTLLGSGRGDRVRTRWSSASRRSCGKNPAWVLEEGHQGLLRQHRPRLVAPERPDGPNGARKWLTPRGTLKVVCSTTR